MEKSKKELEDIIKLLKKEYPEAHGTLNFKTPFQLAVSVALSAQATDARVNKITPALFNVAPNAEEMNKLTVDEIKEYIKSINYFNNKAKNLKEMSRQIVEEYDGKIPNNIEDLQKLAGIGRKSANIIMLEGFNNPVGIAIDTHAKRVSNRLGLSNESDPSKIEQDLMKIYDKKHYKDLNHLFVWHGRTICDSRKPKCDICPISHLCNYYIKEYKNNKKD